jgi:hypothetical protein
MTHVNDTFASHLEKATKALHDHYYTHKPKPGHSLTTTGYKDISCELLNVYGILVSSRHLSCASCNSNSSSVLVALQGRVKTPHSGS